MVQKLIMIKSKLYFIIGLILIISLFYYRVLKIHIPKSIFELNMFLIVFTTILYSIKTLVLLIKLIKLRYFPKKKPNELLQKLYHKYVYPLNIIIDLSYKSIDSYVKDKMLGPKLLGLNLKNLMHFLLNNIGNKHSYYKALFIVFDIIPKTSILMIFGIDIIFFNKLENIYLFSWIILIPLIFKYIIFTLKEFAEYNIILILDNYLLITSNTPMYVMNAEDIINECCCLYRSNILEQCSSEYLNRTNIIVCNFGKTYILNEKFTSKYKSSKIINKLFDDIMLNFDYFRNLREIIYQIEKIRYYWNYLFFEIFRFSYYSILWLYIFFITFN